MSRLGDAMSAGVNIFPDLSGFGRKLAAGVEKETRSLKPDVTVTARLNDKAFKLTAADLRRQRGELNKRIVSIPVDLKDKAARAKLLDLTARLGRLNERKIDPEIELQGAAKFSAELLRLEVQADRLKEKLRNENIGGSGGGLLSRLGGLAGGAGGGIPGSVGPLPLPALAAAIPLVGAVVTELAGLASGFAAAGAGAGAFALLAGPALAQVREGMTRLSGASDKYKAASQNLNIAIHSSPADLAAYHDALKGLEPDLRSAAVLLTNQSAQWQDLTPKQQRAAVALFNNKDAYKELLPSQKQALTALLAEKTAWDGLTPAQQRFTSGLDKLKTSFGKLSDAFAPQAFKVFNDALALADKLLPDVTPFASTFADVVDRLLKQAGKFATSRGFKDWLDQFHGIEGPALEAIGKGLGKVVIAAGKLLTVMSAKDVVNTINIAFTIIAGAINVVTYAIRRLMQNWDGMSSAAAKAFKVAAGAVLQFGIIIVKGAKTIADGVLSAFGTILHGAADAFGWIPGIGPKIKGASKAFDNFKAGVDGNFNGLIGTLQKWEDALLGSQKTSSKTSGSILGDFKAQGKAAQQAKTDLTAYTTEIAANGINTDKAKAARVKLVKDMTDAGVSSKTARADVTNYSLAVATNGAKSDQAKAARAKLNADIEGAIKNSQRGRADLTSFTNAVTHHSSQSDAVRGARQRLINDLIRAGVSSGTAKTDVNNLQTAINRMHGKGISISMSGKGYYTITENGQNFQISQGALFSPHAAGGYIGMGSGPTADDVPILASKGEYVVRAASVAKYGKHTMDAINAGHFASGGPVRTGSAGIARMYRDQVNDEGWSLVSAMRKSLKAAEVASVGNYRAGAGVAQWAGVILRALRLLGEPGSLLGAVEHRMQQESGGNPTIVNKWDINWQEGHPSVGLMQVIRGTFQSNAGPFRNTGPFLYGVSVNPLANTYAGLVHAIRAYPGRALSSVMLQPGGYALGGLVADQGTTLAPGLNLRWNLTGRPEPLVPAGSGGVHLHLTVNGPVGSQAELENWFIATANRTARTGRLTQAVKRAGG